MSITITIESSESTPLNKLAGTEFPSFAAFHSLIAAFAHEYPTTGGYRKTHVMVTDNTTGEQYGCRMDLQHPSTDDGHNSADNDLRAHIVDFCMAMIRNNDEWPVHPAKGQSVEDARTERLTECVFWAELALDAE